MKKDKKTGNGLARKIGLFSVTNIVIANMIGAGIFITSGLLMQDLKNPVIMLVLWIGGGIIALCGAFCYGELGAVFPFAGGEYTFLARLFHPSLGFLSGWVSFFVGFSAPIAASSIGFTEYFTRAIPQLLNWGASIGITDAIVLKKLIAILVILIFTMIHSRGIEFGSRIQNYLTLLKVGLIVFLISFGFSFGKGSWDHFLQGNAFSFGFDGWKTIGLSLMWIMFAYSGWNASAYIGSEIKNPTRNLPRSLILGTSIVMLLYFGLNLFYVYGISPENMKGVISVGGLAVGNLFGKSFENLLSLFISFALFSSLSAFIILGPRVYYSMSKDQLFFRFVSKVHPVFKVPSKSILLQGILATIFVLLGTFDQILTYMGFSLGIFPIIAVIGVFKLRKSKKTTYRMPGFPFAPAIYLVASISILSLAFFERPIESSIAILTVFAGIPVYFMFKNRSEKQVIETKDTIIR
ncbi:APC family permease [Acidobacteriota bacterium]